MKERRILLFLIGAAVGLSLIFGIHTSPINALAAGSLEVTVSTDSKYLADSSKLITINVSAKNNGTVEIANAKVVSKLPTGLNYIYGSATDGGGVNGDSVEWAVSSIAAGGTLDFSYKAKLAPANQLTKSYYVSLTGNDSNDGAISSPFRTLTKARDTIRRLKTEGSLTQPINVNIRGGVYELSAPFDLTEADSGTYEYPITYQSFPGERATITGASKITGTWSNYSGNSNIKTIQLDPTWNFNSLFVADSRATRAREPDAGHANVMDDYYLIKSVNPVDPAVDDRTEKCLSFQYNAGNISPSWANLTDVEVVSFRRWEQSRIKIKKANVSNSTVTFSGRLNFASSGGDRCYDWVPQDRARYYVENALELLDSPGEWYRDPAGKLYYWPASGVNVATADIYAPKTTNIINISGNGLAASNIAIKDLDIKYNDWLYDNATNTDASGTGYKGGQSARATSNLPAVKILNAENIVIEGNKISSTGAYGVKAGRVNNLSIIKNEFTDLGAGGVWAGEALNEVRLSLRITVDNNKVHNYGNVYHEGVGIIYTHAKSSKIIHNTIWDGGYSGISLGLVYSEQEHDTGFNTIDSNHIYNVMKRLDDGGGIYSLGNQKGSVISNNKVHNLISGLPYSIDRTVAANKFTSSAQDFGIYLDSGASGYSIFNNFVHTTSTGLFTAVASTTSGPGITASTSALQNGIYNNVFSVVPKETCAMSGSYRSNINRNIFNFQSVDPSFGPCFQWRRSASEFQQINNNLILGAPLQPNLGLAYLNASTQNSWYNYSAWGDSLTNGATGGKITYPAVLQTLFGNRVVNNLGVGGQTSTQILDRFKLATDKYSDFTIIWVGRNNFYLPDQIKSDIAAIVTLLPNPKKFLVLSILNTSAPADEQFIGQRYYEVIIKLNKDLATLYPNNYLDIRSYLASMYNPSDPQDVIDHEHDVTPSSLRYLDPSGVRDPLHLNANGNTVVANAVYDWILSQSDLKIMSPQDNKNLTFDSWRGLGYDTNSIIKKDNSAIRLDQFTINSIPELATIGFIPFNIANAGANW